jgi:general stress protein 26
LIKKNTETLIDASKEVGLEVNTEKTKYMLLSHHQNAGQNHDKNMMNMKNIKENFYIFIYKEVLA